MNSVQAIMPDGVHRVNITKARARRTVALRPTRCHRDRAGVEVRALCSQSLVVDQIETRIHRRSQIERHIGVRREQRHGHHRQSIAQLDRPDRRVRLVANLPYLC